MASPSQSTNLTTSKIHNTGLQKPPPTESIGIAAKLANAFQNPNTIEFSEDEAKAMTTVAQVLGFVTGFFGACIVKYVCFAA